MKPIANLQSLQEKIKAWETLLKKFQQTKNINEKIDKLNELPDVASLFNQHFSKDLQPEEEFSIKSVLAIGQGPIVFRDLDKEKERLPALLQTLRSLERSYDVIGGIIGYHLEVTKLIVKKNIPESADNQKDHFYHPPGIDISKDNAEVRAAIRWGILSMANVASIYPVGGAGDRLNLHDENTGEALPAAELAFCGHTLLAGLIRDLQAREYVHYKMTGNRLETPIAMMSSHEKNNYQHIKKICEEHQWFGRSRDSFKLFIQPLVPVITINGDWVMNGVLHPMLKPGGHGVIWKLALDNGVFEWLMERGYTEALVRQINNPIAGIDHGIFSFIGWGSHFKKAFGFASCPRLLNTAEGMDVLIEKETPEGVDYRVTNIEYTEFEQRGIKDLPASKQNPYSLFPTNTNILFINLQKIKDTIDHCPIPGMLINMKSSVKHIDAQGQEEEVQAGRLESTMQNIADFIVDHYPQKLHPIDPKHLSTYVTYNERSKTISVAKKAYVPGESLLETQEGCFFELLKNYEELLTKYCHLQVPSIDDESSYIQNGPNFILQFHPALGPIYSVIAQKIHGGVLAQGAELQLEIAELEIEDLDLDGSLLILADTIMGSTDGQGRICYDANSGKCILRRVTVRNKGIDRKADNHYWKNQIVREEALEIILHGNAEFFAEDIEFSGDITIEIPDGQRVVAYIDDGLVNYRSEKIDAPTWHWKYAFDKEDRIILMEK